LQNVFLERVFGHNGPWTYKTFLKQCIYINNQKQSRHKTTNTKNTNSRLKKPQRSKIKIEFLGGLVVDKINKIVN
jgi:hypothetical protein